MLIVYGIFAAFCLIVLAISYVISNRRKNKAALRIKTDVESLKIYLELLKLDESYSKLLATGQLDRYPAIKRYMNDIKNLISVKFYNFDISKIKIGQLDNSTQKNFLQEVNRCPKGAKRLICKKNQLLLKIIFINNDCYKYSAKKDRLELSFFKILIKAAINKSLRNMTINDEPEEQKIKNDIDTLLKESKNDRNNYRESSDLLLNRVLS